MKTNPQDIYTEYVSADMVKNNLTRGSIYENCEINKSYYYGIYDKLPHINKYPLSAYNVIKRIGDYKINKLLEQEYKTMYEIPGDEGILKSRTPMEEILTGGNGRQTDYINLLEGRLEYLKHTMDFNTLCARMLRTAYIDGSSYLYIYTDNAGMPRGDIIRANNIVFADYRGSEVQSQEYIIIKSRMTVKDAVALARKSGGKLSYHDYRASAEDEGITTFTKFYKKEGRVWATTVCERAVICKPLCTELTHYPFCRLCWEPVEGDIYGISEVSALIPNQNAINNLLSMAIKSAIAKGAPIMVVNGDIVPETITNNPGQVLRVYGSGEEIKNAVSYVSADTNENFTSLLADLLETTLNQAGCTLTSRGENGISNAAALKEIGQINATSLNFLKGYYCDFLAQVYNCLIDFEARSKRDKFCGLYGGKIKYYNGRLNKPVLAYVDYNNASLSKEDTLQLALTLYDKKIINQSAVLKIITKGGVV